MNFKKEHVVLVIDSGWDFMLDMVDFFPDNTLEGFVRPRHILAIKVEGTTWLPTVCDDCLILNDGNSYHDQLHPGLDKWQV